MARPWIRAAGTAVVALTLASACTGASRPLAISRAAPAESPTTTVTAAPTTTSAIPPVPVTTSPPPAVAAAPPTTAARVWQPRVVHDTAWSPFAQVAGVVLHHPSTRVERVGFHESNHDGAQALDPMPTAAAPTTLESRKRGTAPRSAADIVSDPGADIRSPVTGTVKRAGRYVLYCKYSDDFAVIEPDARPGWEVKLLHITSVQVRAGDRVVAGETLLALRPTQLPFESQVDEDRTSDPAWPHVHLEVVDPTIKDRPSPGGGCS